MNYRPLRIVVLRMIKSMPPKNNTICPIYQPIFSDQGGTSFENAFGVFFVVYLRTAHQDSIIDFDGKNWQCTPYISGFELNRPGYLHEAWRGDVVRIFS